MSKSTDSMIDKMNETKDVDFRCPDCRWFKGFEYAPGIEGKCHLNPPNKMVGDNIYFPDVNINDYCSHLEVK